MLQRERRIALLESVNHLLGSVIEEVRRPIEKVLEQLETLDLEDREQMRTLLLTIKEQCVQFHTKFEDLDRRIRELQGHENDLRKQEVSLKELEERYQRQFNAFKGSGKG